MFWDRILSWLDNPIFVKHMRSRLRLQALLSGIVVVQALCLCIAWAGFQLNWFSGGGSFATLFVLQIIIIVAVGGAQVASAIGACKSSGILDFHRVSPLSRDELTLGFFFGAPIREYVLLATTLPYSLLCVGFGVPSMLGLIQLMVALIAFAWLFHGMGLLSALLAKPRTGSRGGIGVVVFLVILFLWLGIGMISRSGALVDLDLRLQFFGVSLPWLLVTLLYIGAALFYLFLASRRRMGSDRIHPLSKPQGLAAVLTVSILAFGGIWKQESYDLLQVVALYFLAGASIFTILMVTPTQAEYVKGLLRALKQGRAHLPAWDDLSLNWLFLIGVCAILLVTGTVIWSAAVTSATALPPAAVNNYPLALALSVLVVGYFGLALQFFLLRFGSRGKTYFGLFLFLSWLLPLVAGTIFAFTSLPRERSSVAQIVYSVSPLAGIAMSSYDSGPPGFTKVLQGSAITPALAYLFIFNSLLLGARRRAHREFLSRAALPKHQPDPELQSPAVPITAGAGSPG